MSQGDLEAIQHTFAGLSYQEKVEVLTLLAQSVRAEAGAGLASDQARALALLRAELVALPVAHPDDGWTNRQHDELLYGGQS